MSAIAQSRRSLCLILLTLFSAAAHAQTPEAAPTALGNLPAGFYPAPPCPKPALEEDKGERDLANAQQGLTQLAIDSYHRRTERYNKAVIAYNQCARTYIQNSRTDIERILSTVNAAVAEVQGTAPPQPPAAIGNLPADFYPRSPCVRPDRTALGAPPARTDIEAMTAYNLKVAIYNQQAEVFGPCLKAYQDKARHDIQAIQAAVQPAAANPVPPRRSEGPAAGASAQAALAPAAQPAAPVESVTVTGASSKAVNHFVQAAATPTHIIGKVARWETPICPSALGLAEDALAKVVQRVKEVAVQAGARVASDPACKPNIVIAFTSTPQALLDNIRKTNTEWLGYHSSTEELNRLSTIIRPIQAWYSTATVDLRGLRQIDSSRTDNSGRGLQIVAPCFVMGGEIDRTGPDALCTTWLPNAIRAEVKGSRLTDGLRATFEHVTIIADPLEVDENMSGIQDYIAVLALAQFNSLDTCQALPSITSLLVRGCTQAATEITANDMGFLKALYAANPEKVPSLQKDEIAYRMEQGFRASDIRNAQK